MASENMEPGRQEEGTAAEFEPEGAPQDEHSEVDAAVAAAHSDMEAAAEEMGARLSEQLRQALSSWPPPLPPKRSKREEAEAFFAFAQRLSEELSPIPSLEPAEEAEPTEPSTEVSPTPDDEGSEVQES